MPAVGVPVQRVRVVFAVITALAAVLLRHGSHQPPRQPLAFGELHALGQRHRRIVPRGSVIRAVIIGHRRGGRGAIKQPSQQLGGIGGGERRDALFQPEQSGK